MIKHHSKKVYIRDHKVIKPEFVGKSNKVRMRVVDQTTLDTLLLTDTIMLMITKFWTNYKGTTTNLDWWELRLQHTCLRIKVHDLITLTMYGVNWSWGV